MTPPNDGQRDERDGRDGRDGRKDEERRDEGRRERRGDDGDKRVTNNLEFGGSSIKTFEREDGSMDIVVVLGAIKNSLAAIVTASAIAINLY